MDCPGCRLPMTASAVEGRYGREVTLDHCARCAAFWFDGSESLQLAPHAVLALFAMIHETAPGAPPAPAAALACPRCGVPLVVTSDVQRATPFHYRRCPAEHGRFIGHLDFLREKDFVRPLSPAELARLREQVQTVTCSGCGAPVDLVHDSACRYCRAPLALLDPDAVERVLAQVRHDDALRAQARRELPLTLLDDRLRVERLFDRLDGPEPRHGLDLVRAAVAVVAAGMADPG